MSNYALYVRDADRRTMAEVDHFTRLDLELRFNEVGTWAIDVPPGGDAARRLAPGAGLIVVRDGETLLSGPVRAQRRSWSDERSLATFSGPDDAVYLRDRLAYPVPSGPPYAAAEADVRTGVASTVMRAYVDANAGPGANPERRVRGLALGTDPLIGTSGTWRARFVGLLELLQSIAVAAGDLGFRVVQAGTDLEFQVYQPVDRTRTAIFSPKLGTLRAFEYAVEPPELNYVIVGGGGEGTARLFVERGDPDSIVEWDRIESFRDRRDTTASDELSLTADEELTERAVKTSLSVTPLDTDGLAFGTGYGLGDRVTVVITRETSIVDPALETLTEMQDVIRGIHITLTPDGAETVQPIVGTPDGPDPSPDLGAVRQILQGQRRLDERMSRLERR